MKLQPSKAPMAQVRLFGNLDLLEKILQRATAAHPSVFSGVKFVCVQHLLETTGSLIESFLRLGAQPQDVFLLGKSYSASKSVYERLLRLGVRVSVNRTEGGVSGFDPVFDQAVREQWQRFERDLKRSSPVKAIVVLDDGGHCITGIPQRVSRDHRIAAIEQTVIGLKRINRAARGPQTPFINVARSAAKKFVEPPFVVEALLNKISGILPQEATNCGVIGVGNIGRSLVTELQRRGHSVCVYDKNLRSYRGGIRICKNVSELIASVDYVFGCTGNDAVRGFVRSLGHDIPVKGKKTLISCSSEDIEFRSLLTLIHKSKLPETTPTYSKEDLCFKSDGLSITVVRGGFPANFDDTGESVPKTDIQMTRALLLGAVLQAILCEEAVGNQMLDPKVQRFVVQRWLSITPRRNNSYEPKVRQAFNRLDWIRQQSEGRYASCSKLDQIGLA